jgi:hydrophobe/amphiphile efflux-3 (HAE3) family protein
MRASFTRLGRFVEARPGSILAATIVLVALAVLGATQTHILTTQDVFVDRNSDTYKDNQAYGAAFGGGSLVVMIPGTPQELTSPETLAKIRTLTDQLSKDADIRSIVSPLTLLSAAELPDGVSLDQPGVATAIVFGSDGRPTASFAQLFPAGQELVNVTIQGDLSVDEQGKVSDRVREAVASAGLPSGTVVAGYPRLVAEMVGSIVHDMAITAVVAVLLMVAVLYFVFPVRRRLMALPVVVVGVLFTFGITGAAGVSLTLVTMAGLPILLGLGMDFAIQFHNRYEEELYRGDTPAAGLIDALTHIGPAVGTAVLATILGFGTLYLSTVPAIRDFGGLLALGVAILYCVALVALNAMLYRFDKLPGDAGQPGIEGSTGAEASGGAATPSPARSGREWAPRFDVGRYLAALSAGAVKLTPVVLAASCLLALGGLAVDHLIPVQTDIQKLVPADISSMVAMNKVQEATGSSSSIQFLVSADDVTSANAMLYITQYETRETQAHSQIVSVNSLPSVLGLDSLIGAGAVTLPSADQIAQLQAAFDLIPAPILSGLISSDHKSASITFNIKPMSIAEVADLIEAMQSEANPPAGITVRPAGYVNMAAAVLSPMTERRLPIAIAGFLAVFAGLLVVYRGWRRAVTPVVPIILVTGWSSGAMWLLGIELNPLTAVMSALIVGIGTEFAVLLLERYWEELGRGADPRAAMHRAVSRIGRAIAASALTVTAGFGALLASSFPAIREFGAVTVIDVLLALVATVVVVPPLALLLVRERVPAGPAAISTTLG